MLKKMILNIYYMLTHQQTNTRCIFDECFYDKTITCNMYSLCLIYQVVDKILNKNK